MNDLWERATELWHRLTPRPTIPVDDVIAILQSVNQIAAKRIQELTAERDAARLAHHVEQLLRRSETRSNADQ